MNYRNIATAVDYYKNLGYEHFPEAPWMVSSHAYNATKPTDAPDIALIPESAGNLGNDLFRYLVASGEQSFLQMMIDGQDLKRAICVTPCYRNDKFDSLRRPNFMKAEVINAHDVDEGHLVHMISEAVAFFSQYCQVRVVKTSAKPEFDIIEKNTRIELGSYGIRERFISNRRFAWIYGTGCAEPRLSTVLSRISGK